MNTRSTYGRLIGRITGSGEPAAPLTQLLDEHLSEIAGGRCGCGHSSSGNHISTGSGTNHDSRTDRTVQR